MISEKFALGYLNQVCFIYRDWEQYAEKQRNLKLTSMYLTLSPNFKLDDKHKTNIDTFDFFFRKNCKLMTEAVYNLQRISKM